MGSHGGLPLHFPEGWRTRAAARAAPTISGRDVIEIEIGIGIEIEIGAPAGSRRPLAGCGRGRPRSQGVPAC